MDYISIAGIAMWPKNKPEPQLHALLQVADTLPILLSYVDKDLKYQYNNLQYESLLGFDRNKLRNKPIKELLGEEGFAKTYPYYKKVLSGEHVHFKEKMILANGEKKEFYVHCIPDINNNGKVAGFFAIVKDITGEKASLRLLKAIHQVINQPDSCYLETLNQLLNLARDYLNLDIGIIARIEGNDYTIYALSTVTEKFKIGDKFKLHEAYCSLTLKALDVMSTTFAKENPLFARHPCYINMQLETYIGVPLMINGQIWGTLNFSSLSPKRNIFNDIEKELLRLVASTIETIISKHQELETIELEKRLFEIEAHVDNLTQLPNRNYIDKTIHKSLSLYQQSCICIIDIDKFKHINDTYGHLTGDNVLKNISKICRTYIRKPDITARLGGDELLIVLCNTSLKDAQDILTRLSKHISKAHIFVGNKETIQVTVSGGLTTYQKGESYNKAFERADKALYQAKNNGRAQISIN